MSNIDKRALRRAAMWIRDEIWVHAGNGEVVSEEYVANGETLVDHICNCEVVGTSSLRAEFIAAANPATVLALLDELEAKDATIATQQQEIRTLLNAMEQATDKRNYDITGQKRLIGWRASDYTDETSDPELAKNWAAAIGVLPIFEGDVNTKLISDGIGVKGE
ncbi:TPA: ead/Ea22-like family protein [Enterobacter cloacae]|nr:ead/Ea22-like family protein [Enterobacter cloacae]